MAQLTKVVVGDSSDSEYPFYGDLDTSSEGVTCYFKGQFGWNDTDNEVEEDW
jgi:hypothetical protein